MTLIHFKRKKGKRLKRVRCPNPNCKKETTTTKKIGEQFHCKHCGKTFSLFGPRAPIK